MCSRRWVWEQYDHVILGNTVQRPGGDAAVVRVLDGPKGLALTADVTPRYCEADPFEGGKQAVAEAWRNITAVGGRPLALTDNLNFGNPERPEIMGQFVGCLRGISEACKALDFPVVSGNVSLYNETNGRGILPTPTIGGVGLLDDFTKSATLAFKREGEAILLIGDTQGWLGQSIWLRDICGREEGAPPPVDLAAEKRNGDVVRGMIHARHCDRGARSVRRRLAGCAGRDGDGGQYRREARCAADVDRAACLVVRRGSGALCRHGGGRSGREHPDQDRRGRRAMRADRHHRRRCACVCGERAVAVAKLQQAFEHWFPGLYAGRGGLAVTLGTPSGRQFLDPVDLVRIKRQILR